MEILKLVLTVTELMACVCGFLNWKKLKHSHWKYFPIYLAWIVTIELVGKYLSDRKLYSANLVLYNFFVIPLEILFFIWVFHMEFVRTNLRKLPTIAAVIYVAAWVADTFFVPKGTYIWIVSFSYTLGIVMLLILILASLYKFANSNDIVFIKSNILFWVCMGIFVFYAFSLPFYGMGNYLYKSYPHIYSVYYEAVYFLNYIMYSLFTIAFVWGQPKSSFS